MSDLVRYRDTLVDCLRHWPTLYLNEDDVLLTLFFHIGTGYEWVNGCIVYALEDEGIPEREDPHAERLKDREWREYCVAMPRTKYSHKPCWFKLSAGGVGHYMTELFCQYSHILHLPDDIQPDWLAAAKRALDMARSKRVRTTKEQKVLLRGVALRIKELQDRAKQQGKPHALVQGNVRRPREADVLHADGGVG